MKRTLFLAAGAVLAMVSCSKDETTGINSGEGISFHSAMATRAVETTISNLNDFKVTALMEDNVPYFKDVTFTKGSGTNFTSDPAYYWPASGTLSFFAYAPSSLTGMTINGTTKNVTVTPDAAISKQVDFVTGNATGSKQNEGSGVELTLSHRLSQIVVKAKNDNTNYIFKVKGVKIGQPVSSGTFDFSNSNWQLGSDKTNYMIKYDMEHTLAEEAVSIMDASGKTDNGNAMLIPQQLTKWNASTDGSNASKGAYLSVLVNITTKDGAQVYPPAKGAYGWTAVGIDTNWEAGKKYVYTLDFSDGAGNVDPDGPDGGEEKPDPDPDPDGDKDPGEDIFGSPISFDVTVSTWLPNENGQGVDVPMQ